MPAEDVNLLFFVGGLDGAQSNFKPVADMLRELWGPNLVLHICHACASDDGIDVSGRRIATEVQCKLHTIAQTCHLQSVSFWCHSLGGLCMRAALADLVDPDSRTICGHQPRLFLTTACPHLGLARTFPTAVLRILNSNGGLTDQQLYLEDHEGLVARLGFEDRYVIPLTAFTHLAIATHICNDTLVDFCSAALQPRRASWLLSAAPVAPKYPHVVHDNAAWDQPLGTLDQTSTSNCCALMGPITSGFCCLLGRQDDDIVPYYAGHACQHSLELARRRLAALKWRLICAHFEQDLFQQKLHNSICFDPSNDVVRYICESMMNGPFG